MSKEFRHYQVFGDEPADIVAIMTKLEEAAAEGVRAGLAPRDPLADATAAIARHAAEALRRAKAWAWFHAERAEQRGLPRASDAFADVAYAFEGLQSAACRGMSDSIAWAASLAYRAAIAASTDVAGWYADAAGDHVCEAEESPIGGLCVALTLIADRAWQMEQGHMSPPEAALSASQALLDAPQAPHEG